MKPVFKFAKTCQNPKGTLLSSNSIITRPQSFRFFSQERITHPESSKPTNDNSFHSVVELFSHRFPGEDKRAREDLRKTLSDLEELIDESEEYSKVVEFFEEKGLPLIKRYRDGSAFVKLLSPIYPKPQLALQIFLWRRKLTDSGLSMTSEEYSQGIKIAGRAKDVELAVDLFSEACNNGIKTVSTYNALMSACMFNGLSDYCRVLFENLKKEEGISPSVVTLNIMILVYGRLMLIDHMESTLSEMKDLGIFPNVSSYNHLISGYLISWMWENMEQTYQTMLASSIEPNSETYFLMLRGYAISGNLEQMEATYELVKDYISENNVSLIRLMICAYCRNSFKDRIKKIEELLNYIPKDDRRAWLHCLLIRVYAQEDMIDKMENFINLAFEHKTVVASVGIVRSVIGSYFRCNAVDKVVEFAKRAEYGGWRICRSIYHCKMLMYASQQRVEEMESVLDEMEHLRFHRTKRTFMILYRTYDSCHQMYKAKQVVGMMLKHGYGIPIDASLA